MPEISVIIPVYNGEKTISAAIESVLSQTFKDFEIIIVDDASTDGSYNVALSYFHRYNNVRLMRNEKNSFVGYSRERGLKEAAGKYIYFLDSDDVVYSENVFSEAMKIAYRDYKDGADVVTSTVRLSGGGKKIKGKIKSAADILLFSPYLSQSFYKKEIITRPFSFERKTAEDCEWLYYNLPSANNIAAADFPFYVYTERRKGSITSSFKREYIAPTVETFISMYEAENRFPEADKKRIKRYCADALIEHAIRASAVGDDETVKKCAPYLKKSKAAPFMALSRVIGIKAALKIINLKMKIK